MLMMGSRPMAVEYLTGVPSPVKDVGYSIVGAPGVTTYFYWVVANYSWGSIQPLAPLVVPNAPNVLSATNYVSISWIPSSPQIVTYTVLRTRTSVFPGFNSNAGVVVNTLNTFIFDEGAALQAVTLTPMPVMRAVVFLDGTGPLPVLVSDVGMQVNGNLTVTGLVDEQGVGGQGGNLASWHNYIVTLAPPNWIVSSQGLPDVTVRTLADTTQSIPLQMLPSNTYVVACRYVLLLGPAGGGPFTNADVAGVGNIFDPVTNPNGSDTFFLFGSLSLLSPPNDFTFVDGPTTLGNSTLLPAELAVSVRTTGANINTLTPPCQFRVSVLWGVTSDIGAPA